MRHRVERSIDGSGDWLVLDAHGNVVYATRIWAWAVDEAITRYAMTVELIIRSRGAIA